MKIWTLCGVLLICFTFATNAQRHQRWLQSKTASIVFAKEPDGTYALREKFIANDSNNSELNIRLTAIVLNVALGTFGMHRIYLGTDVTVPVFYTLTLGGGMVLWLIDLGCLIATPDITRYYNNPRIFMWAVHD